MKVQTTKCELSVADFQQLLQRHEVEARRKVRLKKYYKGEHDILRKRGRENTEVNNRLVSNYPAYISNISTGFFIGQPVTYKTSAENQADLEVLLDIFRYNDEQAHNLELAQESSITGESYEFLYIDSDAEIRMATVPSEEIILVTDATLEENILYALRHFKIYDFNRVSYSEFLDVYDKNSVNHYEVHGGVITLKNSEPTYFEEVPIIEFPNNKERRGDFENVLSLVDAYNMAQSLSLDDLEDFTDAFLLIKNMHIGGEEGARDLRRRKIIEVEEGGDASWLIKGLNDAYIENLKNRLQQDIHKFANVPDLSDENFAGNSSGVAIKYKLFGLSQTRVQKERGFKRALQRRIELIANVLRLKNLPAIDFREVEIVFSENLPANIAELAEIVGKLDGVVSQKTLLSLLPFVTDATAELEELKNENLLGTDDSAFYTADDNLLAD